MVFRAVCLTGKLPTSGDEEVSYSGWEKIGDLLFAYLGHTN
jgi:hypothetical protein